MLGHYAILSFATIFDYLFGEDRQTNRPTDQPTDLGIKAPRKNFWSPKIFGPRKIFCSKKMFAPKTIFGSKKFVGPKKGLVPKNYWS